MVSEHAEQPAMTSGHIDAGVPHDLCGLQGGRLTPWVFKVLMCAKWSRFKREIFAPLSGLLAVTAASPQPRPWSVRARILAVSSP